MVGSRLTLALVLLAALLSACSADTTTDDELVPLSSDATGEAVYAARCASCHGEDLRGTDKGPSQLSFVYEPNHHGDAAYRAAIRNGVGQHHWTFGDMPAVEDITADQIERVIAFIRGEQMRFGFER